MKLAALPALLLVSAPLVAEEALPAGQDPAHKPVLKNEYVEVLRVTLPPGGSTGLHVHDHDSAVVRLSAATVRADVPGQGPSRPELAKPGDVSARPCAKQPLTHRVNNVGQTTFDVLDIEVLRRPDGSPAPPVTAPAAENDSTRIYRWSLAAGAATPQHTHERPYLIVAATPMQLSMSGPDGTRMDHPVKAGDVHWVDAKVTHALRNAGSQEGVLVEVELK